MAKYVIVWLRVCVYVKEISDGVKTKHFLPAEKF